MLVLSRLMKYPPDRNSMVNFTYPLQIYYEDTDVNGFVYFTNYLKYMERATTDLIGKFNLKASDLLAMDTLIAVRSIECKYFRPARLDDKVEVVSRVQSYTQVTINWEQTVRSQDNKELIYCHAIIERLCINRQLQPIPLPAQLIEILDQLL